MKIPSSELPKQASGAIYHLNLFQEDIADNIILSGDPDRIPMISAHFDSIELKKNNRELLTHTGMKNGKRVSAISTGMGPDNIEIVMTELDALANVDLEKMEVRSKRRTLNLIRIGTCGALTADIKPGTEVVSQYGFGFDGLLHFYEHPGVDNEDVVRAFVDFAEWNEKLPYPYCVECSQELMDKVGFDMYKGLTATAPGFFAPQGRQVRKKLMYPELKQKIEAFEYQGFRFSNMEMECAALYGLSRIYEHRALTCCLAIANRVNGEFVDDYHSMMDDMIEKILCRI